MITVYNAENNIVSKRPATVLIAAFNTTFFDCHEKAMEALRSFIELQIEAADLANAVNNGQCENAQEKIDAFNTKAWLFFKQG